MIVPSSAQLHVLLCDVCFTGVQGGSLLNLLLISPPEYNHWVHATCWVTHYIQSTEDRWRSTQNGNKIKLNNYQLIHGRHL